MGDVCVNAGAHAHISEYSWGSEVGIRSLAAGDTGGHETLDMGTRNQTGPLEDQ